MRVSRAYDRLERRGLIERVAVWGDKCSHIKPTDAGIALAKQITTTATPATTTNEERQ